MELDTIICGDCLDVMADMPDGCVDLIIADLPYGRTACGWDSIIPFDSLWQHYRRLIKSQRAIVLFGKQPFTSQLIMSNLGWFKYCWVWEKTRPFDFFNCKNKPLEKHEDIVIFSDGTVANCSPKRMIYNPQGLKRVNVKWTRPEKYDSEHKTKRPSHKLDRIIEFADYPTTILRFPNPNHRLLHPTQKPLSLIEYLVRTYSNKGDLVFDNVMGSGTTAVAALKLGRHFYGCDINPEYVKLANERIEKIRLEMTQLEMFI